MNHLNTFTSPLLDKPYCASEKALADVKCEHVTCLRIYYSLGQEYIIAYNCYVVV